METAHTLITASMDRYGPSHQPKVDVYELGCGNRSPLIGVHGAGGVLFFGRLARHLASDQPFYALHGRGLDDHSRATGFADIHQLAEAYADAATPLTTAGPVFLCGRWGPIVLETGNVLHDRCVDIAALIVFDSGPVGRKLERPKSIPPAWIGNVVRIMRRVAGAGARSLKLRGVGKPFKTLNNMLMREYEPKSFPGKVIMIRCEEFEKAGRKQDHVETWRRLCDDLQVRITPGPHQEIFSTPHVEHLGALVQRVLDDTMAERAG